MIKIAMLSLFTREIAPYAGPGMVFKKRYCNHHGIDFFCEDKKLCDRHPSWTKILMTQKFLADYDWIFWIDGDAFIVDPLFDIRKHIEECEGKEKAAKNREPQLIIGSNLILRDPLWNRRGWLKAGDICFGVWLMKNTPFMHSFLADVWTEERWHGPNKPWEQMAVMHRFFKKFKEHGDLSLSQVTHNNGPDLFNARMVKDARYILHLWGVCESQRNVIIRGLIPQWEERFDKQYAEPRSRQAGEGVKRVEVV